MNKHNLKIAITTASVIAGILHKLNAIKKEKEDRLFRENITKAYNDLKKEKSFKESFDKVPDRNMIAAMELISAQRIERRRIGRLHPIPELYPNNPRMGERDTRFAQYLPNF